MGANPVSQLISFVDSQGPTITAPAGSTQDCTLSPPSGTVPNPTPIVVDNCANPGQITLTSGVSPRVGDTCFATYSRTYTAQDNCGNLNRATTGFFYEDTTGPTVTAPASITVSCPVFRSGLPTSQTGGTASVQDDCSSITSNFFNDVTVQFACTAIVDRTFTAVDACSNGNSDSQMISVFDDIPPVFSNVPQNTFIECGPTANPNTGTRPVLGFPGVTDPCFVTSSPSPIVTALFESSYSGNGCTSTYIRTFTATDGCTPAITATQIVTVQDHTRPSITVQGPSTRNLPCTADVPSFVTSDITWGDSCQFMTYGDITFSDQQTVIIDACTQRVTRLFVADDGCSNTRNTQIDYIFSDSTGPSFDDFPPDVTLTCISWEADNTPNGNSDLGGLPVVSDDCNPNPTLTWGDSIQEELCNSAGNPGIIIARTFTADDGCVDPPTNRVQMITVAVETDPVVNALWLLDSSILPIKIIQLLLMTALPLLLENGLLKINVVTWVATLKTSSLPILKLLLGSSSLIHMMLIAENLVLKFHILLCLDILSLKIIVTSQCVISLGEILFLKILL